MIQQKYMLNSLQDQLTKAEPSLEEEGGQNLSGLLQTPQLLEDSEGFLRQNSARNEPLPKLQRQISSQNKPRPPYKKFSSLVQDLRDEVQQKNEFLGLKDIAIKALQNEIRDLKDERKLQFFEQQKSLIQYQQEEIEQLRLDIASKVQAAQDLEQKFKDQEARNQTHSMETCFKCQICTNLVEDPQACRACDQLFCGECINKWLDTTSSCPNCRAYWRKWDHDGHVNRYLRQQLDTLESTCAVCDEKFIYKDRHEHKDCMKAPPQSFVCPNQGCDKVYSKDRAQKDQELENHLKHECLYVWIDCFDCGEKHLKLHENGVHCMTRLKKQIAFLKLSLAEKNSQVESGKNGESNKVKSELRSIGGQQVQQENPVESQPLLLDKEQEPEQVVNQWDPLKVPYVIHYRDIPFMPLTKDLSLIRKNRVSEGIISKMKLYVCQGFMLETDNSKVCDYVEGRLEKEKGDQWSCKIDESSVKKTYSMLKGIPSVILSFQRQNVEVWVIMFKTS